MAANQGWLARADRGPGRIGGPENTATAYFYNPVFNPYGRSWGPLLGGAGCQPAASPSPSIDPCASIVGLDRPVGRTRGLPVALGVDRTDRGPDRAAHGGAHRAADARADPGADARAPRQPSPSPAEPAAS